MLVTGRGISMLGPIPECLVLQYTLLPCLSSKGAGHQNVRSRARVPGPSVFPDSQVLRMAGPSVFPDSQVLRMAGPSVFPDSQVPR